VTAPIPTAAVGLGTSESNGIGQGIDERHGTVVDLGEIP